MNEKQEVAAKIKGLTEQLRQEIEVARKHGLRVQVTHPSDVYSLDKGGLRVEILESLTY